METKVNSVSFRANIKTLTKIKNKSAFLEVKRLFENSTKNDSKDVLYISDGLFGENRVNLDNSPYDSVIIEGINEQLNKMSPNELADKLVKIYEALKSHAQAFAKNSQLKFELNRAKALMKLNSNISRSLASEGKTTIADRYSTLASRNKEKINNLNKEIVNRQINFNKKIDQLSQQYEELSDLKFKMS